MKTRSHDPKKEPRISSAQVKSQFQPRPFAVQAKPQAQETPDLQIQLESAQRFGHNFANISIQNPGSLAPLRIQPKLTIGAPGDKYEQEADKTAAEVVQRLHAPVPSYGRDLSQPESEFVQRMKVGTVQSSNSIHQQGIPNRENKLMKKLDVSLLQREVMPEEDKELQMKPTLQRQSSEGGMSASPDIEATIQQARGRGQPLAQSIREPMEQAFGADFSGVKIHTDAQSDQLNQSIQAKAFTTGQDVFFRQGMYEPGSRGGQELLAHELTHVVQQNGGAVQRSPLSNSTLCSISSSALSAGLIQRAAIEHHALNDNPQPDQRFPNCFMAVLTWLYAQADITDPNTILNGITGRGPGPLMNDILAQATKLESATNGGDQLKVTPGSVVIFVVNNASKHAAISTGALQITGYNQTKWFGQPANKHSHSSLEGVKWHTKDTILNSWGDKENVYQIGADQAANVIGIP